MLAPMIAAFIAGVLVALIAAMLTARAARAEANRGATRLIDKARLEVVAERKAAELAAAATRRALETAARSEALGERIAGDEAIARDEVAVQRRTEALAKIEAQLATQEDAFEQRNRATIWSVATPERAIAAPTWLCHQGSQWSSKVSTSSVIRALDTPPSKAISSRSLWRCASPRVMLNASTSKVSPRVGSSRHAIRNTTITCGV